MDSMDIEHEKSPFPENEVQTCCSCVPIKTGMYLICVSVVITAVYSFYSFIDSFGNYPLIVILL